MTQRNVVRCIARGLVVVAIVATWGAAPALATDPPPEETVKCADCSTCGIFHCCDKDATEKWTFCQATWAQCVEGGSRCSTGGEDN
jgi:hypothetical protein